MKAFMVEKYGDQAGMRAAEIPAPQVGADDVLVKIHAAGVNPLDLRILNGDFKAFMPYRLPLILGNDLAGTVVRVGPSVTRFSVGDDVYARPDKDRIGTFAELIAVPQDDLAPKPATLTMTEAASLPLVALTAWQALVERARAQPGQKVLIHGGAGGLGSIAVQLAKALGAHVASTVSTTKVDLARDLGADVVVDYRTQDFEEVLDGYDVVLDSLGGETLAKSLRVLKPGGTAISVAGPPDPAFARELGANPLLRLAMTALSLICTSWLSSGSREGRTGVPGTPGRVIIGSARSKPNVREVCCRRQDRGAHGSSCAVGSDCSGWSIPRTQRRSPVSFDPPAAAIQGRSSMAWARSSVERLSTTARR
ncbi:NADP-dependent oxidoreductase [Streptomyces sp. NPDC059255]|uniref:NADP-dependent oxidoreductase n=1 Tax=Streptomyces sp. NPDC059255 TaxID=3346793 RepID=UPI0036B90703